MEKVDLRKLALRLKIIEMLRLHCERTSFLNADQVWRQWVLPN